MAKYLLAYRGGSMAETEAEQQQVMAAWGAWFESLGEAVVDSGAPFAGSAAVASDGSLSDQAGSQLTGYSVVQADSLSGATKLAHGCPVRASGGSIEVYEAHEMGS